MQFSAEYLAGLFDGEGCIHIQRLDRKGFRIPKYMVWARINMCHWPLMDALADQLSASVIIHRKDLINPKHRASFEVSTYGIKAHAFLSSIYPYMVIKKEEARLAIILQENIERFKGHASRMSVEQLRPIVEWRESIRLRIKALKKETHLDATDWDVGEVGEPPMPGLFGDAEGQSRAKQSEAVLPQMGVCREHGPTAKAVMCSDLGRNVESAAEMTAPHHFRMVK